MPAFSASPGWSAPKPGSLRLFLRVVAALILRETRTRYGRQRLGYAWALLEPGAYVTLFVVIHSYISHVPPFGQSSALFYTTGVLSFRMIAAISGQVQSAIKANQQLLNYPIVRPLDLVVARALSEFSIRLVVALLAWMALAIYEGIRIVHHPDTVVIVLLAMLFLAVAVGYFNSVLSVFFPLWDQIWGILSFPIFITSGMFYVPSQLPPAILNIVKWSPYLHCVEWFRTGIYLDYTPVLDRSYVLSIASVLFLAAMLLERLARNKLNES
ncbi:ABC transporter permease [Propylenella binzhouense]|uniref:Transport permease protein n=1 Tax=Propylenella binzhouense TaxID=2555902 RepID=A0A964T235_9HYPH|nr:ABC transporter permease [Propylenella binzhouense]MYZ47051.1 hypothetical protein [Propylenella binzhouense]